jgi:glycosyltransferase involved in cell wall biosynthesis
MKILYVVQRYGDAIAGGAEQHCREIAERMAARGHDVEVATTCAHSYTDWENAYEPGVSTLNGVVVNRFPVTAPRDYPRFDEMNRRMLTGRGVRPLTVQREWMRLQGPLAPELRAWLPRNTRRFDCVVVFTFLYWSACAALETVPGIIPIVVHPTVHDEPALKLSIYNALFRAADAFAFSTPEEVELVRRRFRFAPRGAVIGIGVDLPEIPSAATASPRRDLLHVGRIVEGKGSAELIDYFVEYQRRHRSALRLVLLGDPLMEIPARDDIVVTGYVDYEERDQALASALALAQPSYFESFSMVLAESFAHARPALVQGRCDVLRGHARRSGAAIPYSGYAEFECALEMLCDDPGLADRLGRAGRAYVEREYTWPVVLDRYERLLEETVGSRDR